MTIIAAAASASIDISAGSSISVTTPGEAYIDYVLGIPDAGFRSDRLMAATDRKSVV